MSAGLRVLVVDDEALARSRLRTLLGDCGQDLVLQVDESSSASDALIALREQACDLVLLDIHMPGMDGLTLAALLRDLPEPPAVVFVTAHAEHALQAFELEALDYLTKPVRLERLQNRYKKQSKLLNTDVPKVLKRTIIFCSCKTGSEPSVRRLPISSTSKLN